MANFNNMLIQQTPRKMKRILVYPNITARNYEQDSYVDCLALMIEGLNSIRDDLFFYIISPVNHRIKRLDFYNTHQFCVLDIPTHSPTMRVSFNHAAFVDIVKWYKWDFDLIFSHLPEHTLNLVNLLANKTHFEPKVFGYCHWWDFPGVVSWKHTFLNNIPGLLEMDKCFCNTQSQKELVLDKMQEFYNDKTIQRVDTILEPNYLGVKQVDIKKDIIEKTDKIIAFNHRPWAYKDFTNFMKTMDTLYQKRQDFKVWIPLLKQSNRPYVITDKFDKAGYYDFLSKCRVGYGPKQNYRGWSIAITDGLMNGCPFIQYNEGYYQELNPSADFFNNNKEAVQLLEKYLDNESYRNIRAKEALNHAHELIYVNKSIVPLSNQINQSYANIRRVNTDNKVNIIKDIIKKEGTITKKALLKQLGWGVNIKWNKYRTAILDDPCIFDVTGKEPMFIYKKI